MKPSKFHHNRKLYNWVGYNITDKWLIEYSKYYKGTLVDLGCGTAPYKDFFLQYADKYVGVDWTKTLHNSKADIISDLNKKIEIENNFADTIISAVADQALLDAVAEKASRTVSVSWDTIVDKVYERYCAIM
jgi:hypothetical protein